ncbi:MAG: efflux RND transporter periplasmic adaptor subunit [Thermoguttaceae bacterium]|nr:efflux RND transporter periplasmic adaptor subunit [Thermoguttaceae bacterium]
MKPSPRLVALAALFLASALGIAAFSRVASNRSRPTPASASAPQTSPVASNFETLERLPETSPPTQTSPLENAASPQTPPQPTRKSTLKPESPSLDALSQTPDAVPVRTAVATTADVETQRSFRGFTEVDPVEIVPRVRGFLESIEFQPGALVEAGDVLFRVESFDYQNEVDAAKAELAAAIAREARAKATHRRNLQLRKDQSVAGVVTEETLEESQTAWRAANAESAKARARLAAAEKQLERTVVRAPCRGQISRPFYPVGTFLDGAALDPPVLARLVAMDPMLVYFYATDREFLEFQQKRRDALKARLGKRYDEKKYANVSLREALKAENLPDYIDFEARFPGLDEKGVYSRRGVVNYVDNQIDRSTGVVALRGEIPNPDYSIYPGVVCEVALSDEPVKNATLIDVKAVCNDLNSQFVWVVDENDVPRRRPVELGRKTENGSQVVATSGIKPGERYVVDGVLNLRPGLRVVEAAPRKRPAVDEPFLPNERETAVASTPESDVPAQNAETFRAAKPVAPVPATSPKLPNGAVPVDASKPSNNAIPADASNRPNGAGSKSSPNSPNGASPKNSPNSPNNAIPANAPNSPSDAIPEKSPIPLNGVVPESSPNRLNNAAPENSPIPSNAAAPENSPTPSNVVAPVAASLNVNYADRAASLASRRDASKSPTPPPSRRQFPASNR